jgi:mono/diheme cytochrome c family protein
MKNTHLSALLTAIVFAASALSFDLPRAAADDEVKTGDPVKGERICLAVGCFECHGRAGQGGRFNYPTLALTQIERRSSPSSHFCALRRTTCRHFPPMC